MGCSSVEEYKKVKVPVYVAPTWRLDRSSDPNQLCQGLRVGDLANVITHAKFEIN